MKTVSFAVLAAAASVSAVPAFAQENSVFGGVRGGTTTLTNYEGLAVEGDFIGLEAGATHVVAESHDVIIDLGIKVSADMLDISETRLVATWDAGEAGPSETYRGMEADWRAGIKLEVGVTYGGVRAFFGRGVGIIHVGETWADRYLERPEWNANGVRWLNATGDTEQLGVSFYADDFVVSVGYETGDYVLYDLEYQFSNGPSGEEYGLEEKTWTLSVVKRV